MTIVIEILILLALLLLLYAQWKGKPLGRLLQSLPARRKPAGDTQKAAEMEAVANGALHALHCEVKWETEKEVRVGQYDYQNGHFQLRIDPSCPFASLSYLFCYTLPMDQINQVRNVVNRCNINSDIHRIVYSINGEKNEIDLHIMAGMRLNKSDAREVLALTMAGMFAWQNSISRLLSDNKDQKGSKDLEADTAVLKRQLFLLHEHEMRLQGWPMVCNDTERIGLGAFIDKALGLSILKAVSLEFPGMGLETLTDSEDIIDYDLTGVLFHDGHRVADQAVAMLRVVLPEMPHAERLIVLTFNEEGSDGSTDYFRVTACLIPLSARPGQPFSQQHLQQHSNSVLLAYDHVSRQQQRDESLYMWKEAVQKLHHGKNDELTDDLLAQCTDPGLAHLLYTGKKLYLDGRYYEALLDLENAFLRMRKDFDSMSEEGQQGFYDLIYDIGFCYSELMMYDRALFYLGMLFRLNRITYTMEYVNCLVNSRDYRALQTIDSLIEGVKINFDEDEEMPDHILKFLSFLHRRKVYVLIDKEQYKKAQRMLKKMLNEPDNADFALNELAYIQKKMKD